MQTVKQIQQLLGDYTARPQKKFGQCFLIDLKLMEKVIELGQISSDDTVVEVGPGTGSLTEELIKRSKRVVACEIDRALAALLRDYFADEPTFTLVEGDALAKKSQINYDLIAELAKDKHVKLVANLPYNIATSLIANMILASWATYRQMPENQGVIFDSMTFTVQEEVAQRMACTAGPDYGQVSVLLAILGKVTLGKLVPRTAFWPKPKIESRIVHVEFSPTQADNLKSAPTLTKLLSMTFTQRRKHIGTTCKARNAPFEKEVFFAALERAGIDRNIRADELTPEQYLNLANELAD